MEDGDWDLAKITHKVQVGSTEACGQGVQHKTAAERMDQKCCKRKTCSKGGQVCCQGSKRWPGKAEASMPCLCSTCATRDGKDWTWEPPVSTHPNWTSLPSQLKGTTFRPGEIIHPSCPVVQSHRRVQAPVPNLKEALGVPCPFSMLAPYCPGLGAHEGHVSVPPQMWANCLSQDQKNSL